MTVLANGMTKEQAAHWRDVGAWTNATHWAMFCDTVTAFPDAPAAADKKRSLTYRELRFGAECAARHLSAAGIARGDTVIVQLPNCVAYLEIVLGLFRLGAVPVFALPAHGIQVISNIADKAPARFLLMDARAAAKHGDAVSSSGLIVIPVDCLSANGPWGGIDDSALPTLGCVPDVQGSDLALFQLSGGTTGLPKLIARTHDDYLYSVRASVALSDLDRESRFLVALPASHNFTMSSPGILGCLLVGAEVVFARDPSALTVLPMVERFRITHMPLVPPLVAAYLDSDLVAATDLSSWRTVWVGGAKLAPAVAQRIGSVFGCRLQQVYGMAEGLVNYTRLDDPDEIIVNTQGRPMSPFDEIVLADPADLSKVDPSSLGPGVLCTRGPYTIGAYHNNEEANATSFTKDGFYITGDIVVRDAAGNVTVTGRVKDQINRGGEKIAPVVIEEALLTHEAVRDVSVVGIPDDLLGEKICAFIIPAAHGTGNDTAFPSDSVLRRWVRDAGVPAFAIPDVFRIVDHFPSTGVGKTAKNKQRGSNVGHCQENHPYQHNQTGTSQKT